MHTHTGPHMVLQGCPMVAIENTTTTYTSTYIYRNTYTDTTHIQTHIHRHTDRMFNLQPARYIMEGYLYVRNGGLPPQQQGL